MMIDELTKDIVKEAAVDYTHEQQLAKMEFALALLKALKAGITDGDIIIGTSIAIRGASDGALDTLIETTERVLAEEAKK